MNKLFGTDSAFCHANSSKDDPVGAMVSSFFVLCLQQEPIHVYS